MIFRDSITKTAIVEQLAMDDCPAHTSETLAPLVFKSLNQKFTVIRLENLHKALKSLCKYDRVESETAPGRDSAIDSTGARRLQKYFFLKNRRDDALSVIAKIELGDA